MCDWCQTCLEFVFHLSLPDFKAPALPLKTDTWSSLNILYTDLTLTKLKIQPSQVSDFSLHNVVALAHPAFKSCQWVACSRQQRKVYAIRRHDGSLCLKRQPGACSISSNVVCALQLAETLQQRADVMAEERDSAAAGLTLALDTISKQSQTMLQSQLHANSQAKVCLITAERSCVQISDCESASLIAAVQTPHQLSSQGLPDHSRTQLHADFCL